MGTRLKALQRPPGTTKVFQRPIGPIHSAVVTTRLARRAIAALGLGCGVAGLWLAMQSLRPEYVYRKDFIQEYVLARAIRAGINPYLPPSELAAVFRIDLTAPTFPHPTPHPPGLALVSWPMAWLPYPRAAALWMGIELSCLVAGVALLARWYNPKVNWRTILLVSLAATGSEVVWRDLLLGQSGTLLFALLAVSWAWLRSGRDGLGGAALGVAIALKLTAWPMMVVLIVARRWAGVVAAGATIAIAQVAAVAVMGLSTVAGYYLHVAPLVATLYRASFLNLSPASLGWRLFDGTGSAAAISYLAPPVAALPSLAPIASYAVALAILVFAVWQMFRIAEFDARFALMVATSLLVSPIVWDHYLLVAAIPGLIIAANLRTLGYPRRSTALAIAGAVLVALPGVWLALVPGWFARPGSGREEVVPAAISLLALMPTVAVLTGLVLCAATSREAAKRMASSMVNSQQSTVDSA